jgi:uncharacterized protein involved in type VI secretion and phage assembly
MNRSARPEERSQSRIDGVVTALVTDNDDPKNMGRVRLTYPWRDDTGKSGWVRVATTMAGPNRGTFFVPEVDDEVLVAFENGDIHHPYVLGALWNGVDEPPYDNSGGGNDVRMVKSKSGHTITFDDTEDAERIEIETGGGHRIVLDDASSGARIELSDGDAQNKLTFDAGKGEVELVAATTLRLSAPAVEFASDGNLTVEAGGVLTLNGSLVKLN